MSGRKTSSVMAVGTILPGQRDRRLAAVGDDALEALVARESQQDARVVRIVVDDQQHVVAFADVVAIVGDDLLGLRDGEHRQRRRAGRVPIGAGLVAGAVTARADRCTRSAGRA